MIFVDPGGDPEVFAKLTCGCGAQVTTQGKRSVVLAWAAGFTGGNQMTRRCDDGCLWMLEVVETIYPGPQIAAPCVREPRLHRVMRAALTAWRAEA